MSPGDDDFSLFGLPRRFRVDRTDIDARRRALQAEVHPDRFAASDPTSRRVAMQWAVRINEAYDRLRQPLARARLLCELAGVPIAAEDNTAMPADFLLQQMAWREALDDARSRDDVERLASEVASRAGAAHDRLAEALDRDHDAHAAAAEVRALMFIERFAADVDDRLEAVSA